MKSIMHDKAEKTCYLCKMFNGDYSVKTGLQEHHVFGAANRPLSTKFGLTVYLCLWHHTEGKEAVHNNAVNMDILHKAGQKAFESKYPELNFKNIFGRNYL